MISIREEINRPLCFVCKNKTIIPDNSIPYKTTLTVVFDKEKQVFLPPCNNTITIIEIPIVPINSIAFQKLYDLNMMFPELKICKITINSTILRIVLF